MSQNNSIGETLTHVLIGFSAYLGGMDAICKRTDVLPHDARIMLSRSKERADQLLDDVFQGRTRNLRFSDIEDISDTILECATAHWGTGCKQAQLLDEQTASDVIYKEPILSAADSIIYNIEAAKATDSIKMERPYLHSNPEPTDVPIRCMSRQGDPVIWGASLNSEFLDAMVTISSELQLELERVLDTERRSNLTVTTVSPGPIEPIVFKIAVHSLAKQNILPSQSIRNQLADCSNLNADFHTKISEFWALDVGVNQSELLKAVDWFNRAGDDESFGESQKERRATIDSIVEEAWKVQQSNHGKGNRSQVGIERLRAFSAAQKQADGSISSQKEDPDLSPGPSFG